MQFLLDVAHCFKVTVSVFFGNADGRIPYFRLRGRIEGAVSSQSRPSEDTARNHFVLLLQLRSSHSMGPTEAILRTFMVWTIQSRNFMHLDGTTYNKLQRPGRLPRALVGEIWRAC